jgi:4-carboxymuconolactone decarboxylase
MEQSVRSLIALCSAVGARNRAALAITIDAAAEQADPAQAEEALLQSYLFVGFPIALQALAMWRERTGHAAPAKASKESRSNLRSQGEIVCQTVYAGQYDKLKENIARLHPDMERWMLEEGYGKVLSRPGLDLKLRELCIVGVLVGLDAPQQLYSHLRGALNAGATQDEVDTAVEIACAQSSITAKENARTVWNELKARSRAAGKE